jgi:hypothetical protein
LRDVDDLASRRFEARHHAASLGGVCDRGRAKCREARADGQHDVRVIDRPAPQVDSRERHDLVAQGARELAERIDVRARREARVRDARGAIEHHAAGAFEILPAGFEMREVYDSVDAIAARIDERVENVAASLAPPARRQHRVEHGGAVGVQAEPVVREDFVG